jgi:hypothetical protein
MWGSLSKPRRSAVGLALATAEENFLRTLAAILQSLTEQCKLKFAGRLAKTESVAGVTNGQLVA